MTDHPEPPTPEEPVQPAPGQGRFRDDVMAFLVAATSDAFREGLLSAEGASAAREAAHQKAILTRLRALDAIVKSSKEREEAARRETVAILEAVIGGCPRCDYDEAEGDLFRHCAECQFKVTQAAWELVNG